jgi:hypothetical protein
VSRAALFVLLVVASLLAACGGNGDEVECRPDFVGPPAPSQAHLPVCEVLP